MSTSLLEDIFLSSLYRYYEREKEESIFAFFQEKAWEVFLKKGLPKREGAYQYIPLGKLYGKEMEEEEPSLALEDIDSYIDPRCKNSYLLFVDGHFNKELSKVSKKVVLKTVKEAFRTYGTYLNNHLNKMISEEKDSFALLNMALCEESAFLYIPPHAKVEEPIQILHIVSGKRAQHYPRVQFFVGSFARVVFFNKTLYLGEKESCFLGQVHDFSLEEGSKVSYYNHGHAPSWHFEFLRVSLKKNSSFTSVSASKGGFVARQDYKMSLLGENSQCLLYGLWDLKKNKEAHTHVFMEHKAFNCKSLQLFKGVLDDTSKSSFEGKIYVHPEAQKTDAFQLNNHLFLSPHVIANSKPNLEIFADDVKASHGATFGKLNEDSLFYLKTRGLSEERATELLIQGFTKEILDFFPFEIQ